MDNPRPDPNCINWMPWGDFDITVEVHSIKRFPANQIGCCPVLLTQTESVNWWRVRLGEKMFYMYRLYKNGESHSTSVYDKIKQFISELPSFTQRYNYTFILRTERTIPAGISSVSPKRPILCLPGW